MAAPTQPDNLRAAIVTWLEDHPGPHRSKDIAAGLTQPAGTTRTMWTRKIANEVARLGRPRSSDRAPILVRHQTKVEGRDLPITTYQLPSTHVPERTS